MKKLILATIPFILFLGSISFVGAQETVYCLVDFNDQTSSCYSTEEQCNNANTGSFLCTPTAGPDAGRTFDTRQDPVNYKPLAPLNEGSLNDDGSIDLANYLPNMVNLLIAAAAVLAVVMIVIGGIEYMSTDAISGKTAGRERIKYAVGGLILAIAAWLILYTINPNILNINIASVDRDVIPAQAYSSLSNAPEGWYAQYEIAKPYKREKYGPFKTLEDCEATQSVTSVGGQNIIFKGCLSEFEEPEIYASLAEAEEPGQYVEFDLMTFNRIVFFGPYPDKDFCDRFTISQPSSGNTYNHVGEGECDVSMLEDASNRQIYDEVTDIPSKGMYKRHSATVGRVVQYEYYGPYVDAANCEADSNVTGTCGYYGPDVYVNNRKEYEPGAARPLGAYKKVGVFDIRGTNYMGRVESSEVCQSVTDANIRQVINRDDLAGLSFSEEVFNELIILFNAIQGTSFGPITNNVGSHVITNVSCSPKSGDPSNQSWKSLSDTSGDGAFGDYIHYSPSNRQDVFYGPYATAGDCSSQKPVSETEEILESGIVLAVNPCIANQ